MNSILILQQLILVIYLFANHVFLVLQERFYYSLSYFDIFNVVIYSLIYRLKGFLALRL